MKTKILHSYGNREIREYEYDLGEMQPNEMLIESIYTGICRSDIDQYLGKIGIPFGHFGHESLGRVARVGDKIRDFVVGDLVASRCDPAYSQWFYATEINTVHVDSVTPKNIIEPVACSVNIGHQMYEHARGNRILFIGSGFVSNIAAQYMRLMNPMLEIYVIGTHNATQWNALGAKQVTMHQIKELGIKFKNIVELTGKASVYDDIMQIADTGAVICLAASFDADIQTNFFKELWNNYMFIFPSPRTTNFKMCMERAASLSNSIFDLDWVWTHEYHASDFERAFAESVERTGDEPFVRSYLRW